MRTKTKSLLLFVLAAVMAVCTALALAACGGSGLRIDVPEDPVEAEFGNYNLPEYNVVDANGVIMMGYTVRVVSVTDPDGDPVEIAYNQIGLNKEGIYRVTYTADSGDVPDAVLQLDAADRTPPGITVTSEIPRFFIKGNTYPFIDYQLTGNPDMSRCWERVEWFADENAQPVEVEIDANGRFAVENNTGFYRLTVHYEDANGNAEEYTRDISVDGPEGELVEGRVVYGSEQFGERQLEAYYRADETYEGGFTAEYKKDEGDDGSWKLEATGNPSEGMYFRIALPVISDFSPYDYFVMDVYNGSERQLMLALVVGQNTPLAPEAWTRVAFPVSIFSRTNKQSGQISVENSSGTRIDGTDISGLAFHVQAYTPPEQATANQIEQGEFICVSNVWVTDNAPFTSDPAYAGTEETADKVGYFDTAAGVTQLAYNPFGYTTSYSFSYDTSVAYDDEAGSTKITMGASSVGNDVYFRGIKFSGPYIADLTDYDYVEMPVYNPNDFDIRFGYSYQAWPINDIVIPAHSWGVVRWELYSRDKNNDAGLRDCTEIGYWHILGANLDGLMLTVSTASVEGMPEGSAVHLGGMYAYKYPAYRFEIDEIADVSYAKDGTYTVAEYPVLNRYGYAQDNADVTITVVGPDNQNVSLDAENTFTVSAAGKYTITYFAEVSGTEVEEIVETTIYPRPSDESIVAGLGEEYGIGQVSAVNGQVTGIEYSADFRHGAESGSTKVTLAGGIVESGIALSDPWFTDASSYDYLSVWVYNPNSVDIGVGTWWNGLSGYDTAKAGQWSEIRYDLAWESIQNSSYQPVITASDIHNYVIRIFSVYDPDGSGTQIAIPENAALYIGNVRAYESTNYIAAPDSLRALSSGSEYEIPLYPVYNSVLEEQDVAVSVTVRLASGESVTVTDGKVTLTQPTTELVVTYSAAGCKDTETRITVYMVEQGNGVVAGLGEAYGTMQVTALNGQVTGMEYSSDFRHGDESGSTKVTLAGGTVESGFYLSSPWFTDASAYDYLSVWVYNPNDVDITVGTWWNGLSGYDTAKAGQWSEIRYNLAWTGIQDNANQTTISAANISNYVIRICSAYDPDGSGTQIPVPANAALYFGSIRALNNTNFIDAPDSAQQVMSNGMSYTIPVYPIRNSVMEDTGLTPSFTVRLAGGGAVEVTNGTIAVTQNVMEIVVTYHYDGCEDVDVAFTVTREEAPENLVAGLGEAYGTNQITALNEQVTGILYTTEQHRDGESGSAKVTLAGGTVESGFYLSMPWKTDWTGYDYLSMWVYNSSEVNITVGTWWAGVSGYDTAKAGQWSEIRYDLSWTGIQNNSYQAVISASNIQGYVIRICNFEGAAIPEGAVLYFGNLYARNYAEEEIQIAANVPAEAFAPGGVYTLPAGYLADPSGNVHEGEVAVAVTDAEGAPVAVSGNTVTIAEEGEYTLTYTAQGKATVVKQVRLYISGADQVGVLDSALGVSALSSNAGAVIVYDSAVRYQGDDPLFADENGSAKINFTSGGDQAIILDTAAINDVSAYDQLVFYVYLDGTSSQVISGTWWASDTVLTAGQWTKVTVNLSDNVMDVNGDNIKETGADGFVFRFLGGYSGETIDTNATVWISSLYGVKNA
ncbi:MAG TPA: hypothetical protein H9726_02600 [Candidatus Borkfalkia avicola]|uniref:Uncharacterized protein n=1 Tax=Candidatus Borkfalkia avicola TaxID=2838503 RepID=A0A9D2II98_9FIRM|nr:hypothetical protein [Candidatus Borkfalkia avicola]